MPPAAASASSCRIGKWGTPCGTEWREQQLGRRSAAPKRGRSGCSVALKRGRSGEGVAFSRGRAGGSAVMAVAGEVGGVEEHSLPEKGYVHELNLFTWCAAGAAPFTAAQ